MKLVIFGKEGSRDLFPEWDTRGESSDLQYCDVVLLTKHQLLSIYAVDHLLMEELDEDQRQAAFAHVSGEIDFFWKMITRPVWGLVSQAKPVAH